MAGPIRDPVALPSGAPTFVFTDVEGSTALLRRLGPRYPDLLDLHRTLILTAVTAHGGVHVSSEGDALFLAFDRAADAVAAAADAQRALGAHPWPLDSGFRVRMGVHTGPAELVDGDYVGLAVHVAARVAAAAHGGQVLLTGAVLAQAPEAAAVDLGEHRLRGIPGVVRLLQLTGEGLATGFPPPRVASTPTTDLPTALDEFAALDDRLGSAWMAWVAAQRATDRERAVALATEAVERFRALDSPVGLAHALEGRALVALDVADRATATAVAREAVELLGRAGSLGCTAHALEAVAASLVEGGDVVPVAELAAAAEALRERSGVGHRPWERRGHERVLAALGDAGREALDDAWRRGRARSLTSAVDRAVALLADAERSPR